MQTDGDRDVVLGIGDDAAIIRPREGFDLCFSADMLLRDRHFFCRCRTGGFGLEGFGCQYFRYGGNGCHTALGAAKRGIAAIGRCVVGTVLQ